MAKNYILTKARIILFPLILFLVLTACNSDKLLLSSRTTNFLTSMGEQNRAKESEREGTMGCLLN